ncbi:MAG: 16S rRNA (cytosine(967)-C(5))-methyltransferase RsmB [Clostridia bacterium]|jgi:16S rRNA (cytosine967-C5)-methyltransferase|nr:16S rRNA (cytosine(967)-C(5))-methyltransferase RsmB [Clostridia bacterium]
MQAREAAYLILKETEQGAYANIALDAFFRKQTLPDRDKRFITELVYGTVKNRLKLDWIIAQLVKKPAKLETGPKILLRSAFYQLLFMERVPPQAVTHEAVKLAKKLFHQGTAGLVNAVLRNFLRNPKQIVWPDAQTDPARYLEIAYSHPAWMIERWLQRYGFAATEELCRFNNQPADLWIRTNTLRTNRDSLVERLHQEGCQTEKSSRVPEGILLLEAPPLLSLPAFQEGLFTVQDETSMLPAHVLGPLPGQTVLDACAAPGGKTTHLAQRMENKGLLIACDVHAHRLKLIEQTAERLGIRIISPVLQDAAQLHCGEERQYDLILVDAPCSGLGVLRRRPDSRWRKKAEDIAVLAALQLKILERTCACLKEGGRLLYCTCTMEPEENYEVIEKLLEARPEMKRYDLTAYLPYEEELPAARAELEAGTRQYLPFRDKMEGFFLAGLEKRIAGAETR